MAAFGLIAGLSYTELQAMMPGLILDLFFLKREYDDEQHGLKRE